MARITYVINNQLDETLFVCVLIVFGIVIYTNSISFVSGLLNSEKYSAVTRSINRIKKYAILEQLVDDSLIDMKLASQISDNIESFFNKETMAYNEHWMELIPLVQIHDQLMVDCE